MTATVPAFGHGAASSAVVFEMIGGQRAVFGGQLLAPPRLD
jgi:hypothetical protein